MLKLNNRAVPYYTVPLFEKTGLVRHGFSTRMGGVSSGCYSSMNLRFGCDDKSGNVKKNFAVMAEALGMDYTRLVLSKQVHESEIININENHCGNGIITENEFESADALVTDRCGIGLVTLYADCVPVLLLDKRQGVIASVHSGWKGTVKYIGAKTVSRMVSDYNSRPEDILCAIGPSIQVCHFEVGDDVAEIFIDSFGSDTAVKYGGRYHVNMQLAIEKQLRNVGVLEDNIENSGLCTYCMSDVFFSHRKTQGRRGNFGAFIELI